MASPATTKWPSAKQLLSGALLLNAAALVFFFLRSTYAVDAMWAATRRNPVSRDWAGVADRLGMVEIVSSLLATVLCLFAMRRAHPQGSSRRAVYLLILSLIILVIPFVILV